jgi:hypothetical protein
MLGVGTFNNRLNMSLAVCSLSISSPPSLSSHYFMQQVWESPKYAYSIIHKYQYLILTPLFSLTLTSSLALAPSPSLLPFLSVARLKKSNLYWNIFIGEGSLWTKRTKSNVLFPTPLSFPFSPVFSLYIFFTLSTFY